MVRSHWIRPVVVMLAWTGLARGQAVPPALGPGGERIVTIQVGGKPGQRCRVLRTWQQPDGSRAHQVQALDTGEIMTVEESGAASTATNQKGQQVKAVTIQVLHRSPPPDTPVLGEARPVTPGPAAAPV